MSQADLHALVLAGGRSSRMGRDKASVVIEGRTLLDRTVELARDVASDVFVSVRSLDDADGPRAAHPRIADSAHGEGPMAGILAALEHAPHVDWLILACDLPRLDGATLAALRERAGEDPESNAVAMKSERDGLPEPMCAIWRATMRDQILARFAEQRFCARKTLIIAGATLVEAVTPGALDNMNTERDLADILLDRQRAAT